MLNGGRMLKFKFDLGPIKIDYIKLNSDVASDLIKEIKRIIASGKNTDGQNLSPKNDGSIPTFIDTNLMMGSMDFTANENGFDIFISNGNRALVMSYINMKRNWTIFKDSKILDDFCAKQYDKYLQIELDKI